MRYLTSFLLIAAITSFYSEEVEATEKPRLFVLTDIENEPDDAMSMGRLLTYANQIDIEGLAATTSVHQQRRVATQRIRQIVEAYGKVRDNLELHKPGYPTAAVLLDRVTEGLAVYGMHLASQTMNCLKRCTCTKVMLKDPKGCRTCQSRYVQGLTE